jgi:Protein kinase domain/Pentapeptide repeats (8 copies)
MDHRPTRSSLPDRIGAYRVLSRLGVGGMGQVYKAQDPDGRLVAIKVVRPEYATMPEFRERFVREVRNAQRVPRYWTAEVLGARLDGDLLYLVTEFINGPTLSDAVATGGPWSDARLEQFGLHTAAALSAIHRAGLIHRDLKPSNVLLSESGPRVIDFGIARAFDASATALTATGQVIGTPGFIAPEVHRGRAATPAADVFAWGGVMVYAATGRYAFGSENREAVVERVLTTEPDLSGLRGSLRAIVEDALAKDPAARPTPEELQERLSGVPAPAPPAPQPQPSPSRATTQPEAVAGLPGDRPAPTETHAGRQPGGQVATQSVGRRRLRRLVLPGAAVLLAASVAVVLLLWTGPPAEPETGPKREPAPETAIDPTDAGGPADAADPTAVDMSELADRLGSDRVEVRIAAINGLDRLAHQQPDQRVAIIDVLSAWLHRRVPRPASGPPRHAIGELGRRMPDVDAAMLAVVGHTDQTTTGDLSNLDLTGAALEQANLRTVDLRGTILSNSVLAETDLRDAFLDEAVLRGADMMGAVLARANLEGADLSGATLWRANLWATRLQAADLAGADLREASLIEANLIDADLTGADLTGADLRNATGSSSTRWPDGLDWRAAGARHCADLPQPPFGCN